jgi:hypothetical protein
MHQILSGKEMQMGFIQREIARIARQIMRPENEAITDRLYAAQQALWWALDPDGYACPSGVILGTAEDREDCPAEYYPEPSSGMASVPQ